METIMTTETLERPATAKSKAERPATKAMAEHRDYRGFMPFSNLTSADAIDRAASYLSDAKCILSMLSAAFSDSGALIGKGMNSEFDNRNPEIMAGAMDGIATLIDMGGFLLDDGV
jgi:hypothetical protein